MALETATGLTVAATDQCVGFAEPAEILTRLTPDDLHPARLAGPHAWHPWGLTAAPPTDRHLRLVLPPTVRAQAVAQVLDRLEGQLARTPWPPDGPLEIRRTDGRLDCRDDDARQALIEVAVANRGEGRGLAEVVTRDGWPILDEPDAVDDRIRCIDPEGPSRADLADLASWVEHKMTESGRAQPLTSSLPQLLSDLSREQPSATARLRSILSGQEVAHGEHFRVLNYLAEQLHERLPFVQSRSR